MARLKYVAAYECECFSKVVYSKLKWLVFGFALACLIPVAGLASLWFFQGDHEVIFHNQALASGKVVKIISCNLVWGIEHEERNVSQDSFQLEYVSTVSHSDLSALDRESEEVFELIRPLSEQWGFRAAAVVAFPTTQRKGRYFIYNFARTTNGSWSFERHEAKVFVND